MSTSPSHDNIGPASVQPVPAGLAREWLVAEQRRLARVVAELTGHALATGSGVGEGHDGDEVDHDSSTLEREVEFSLLDDYRDALVEVGAALDRVAAGRYGRCERCATPIPFDRLAALPATRWCVDCSDTAERQVRWPTGARAPRPAGDV